MTRAEWYAHWRQVRLSTPKPKCNLVAVLRELYDYSFNDKEQAQFDLTNRYYDRVSDRLKKELEALKIVGKERAKEIFKTFLYSENPFLKLMSKDNDFQVSYYPIPIIKS